MPHPHHNDPHAVNYLIDDGSGDAVNGAVRPDTANILWNGGMALIAMIAGPLTLSWGAVALFVVTTGAALLLGHSLGYHRMMIHGSFAAPRWVERTLIWFGAWVGMAGPHGIIRAHDMRDWAQRQSACHPYFAHRTHPLRDAWWQIYCRIDLKKSPRFDLSPLSADPFIGWLERHWRWQQLPVALLFYAVGGWGWVVWGVAARVAVATHGHWLVGHLAHTRGQQRWMVNGAGVQAYDVPWAAIPTMGEAWHNNHHAYPGSARIGLYPGQSDWGYAVLRLMARLGLVHSIQTPETLGARAALVPAARQGMVHSNEQGRTQGLTV
jgi:fatty-acid desaturase